MTGGWTGRVRSQRGASRSSGYPSSTITRQGTLQQCITVCCVATQQLKKKGAPLRPQVFHTHCRRCHIALQCRSPCSAGLTVFLLSSSAADIVSC